MEELFAWLYFFLFMAEISGMFRILNIKKGRLASLEGNTELNK